MMDTFDKEDYFDCPHLKAKIKLRACDTYREEATKRLHVGMFPRYSSKCKECAGWTLYKESCVSAAVYEDRVFKDMGGPESLIGPNQDLEGLAKYEKSRILTLAGRYYKG